jgi:Protein of unknown function (DUF3237)
VAEPIPNAVELVTTLLIPKQPEDVAKLREGIAGSGGVASGPGLNGRITSLFVTGNPSPGGKGLSIVAEMCVLTDDGAEILLVDRGEWRGAGDSLVRMLANEFASPHEHYLVGVVKFQTSDPRYTWLNDGQFFSHAVGQGDRLKVSVYRARRARANSQ